MSICVENINDGGSVGGTKNIHYNSVVNVLQSENNKKELTIKRCTIQNKNRPIQVFLTKNAPS